MTAEEKQPFHVHCKSCGHEWVAFWLPLTMDKDGMALLRSAGNSPCPKCAKKPVLCGKAPT